VSFINNVRFFKRIEPNPDWSAQEPQSTSSSKLQILVFQRTWLTREYGTVFYILNVMLYRMR